MLFVPSCMYPANMPANMRTPDSMPVCGGAAALQACVARPDATMSAAAVSADSWLSGWCARGMQQAAQQIVAPRTAARVSLRMANLHARPEGGGHEQGVRHGDAVRLHGMVVAIVYMRRVRVVEVCDLRAQQLQFGWPALRSVCTLAFALGL